jgi:hypothetical protein
MKNLGGKRRMQARWVLFVGALALAAVMALTATDVSDGASAPRATVARAAAPVRVTSAQTSGDRIAREFLKQIKLGTPLHAPRFGGRASGGVGALSSTNWSGYAGLGIPGSFTTVSASWAEPKATCGKGTSLAAFWVGLDGLSSSDPTVEQDGTLIECMGGTASYYDWWETYPGNAVQLQNMVAPGDIISAQVMYNGSYAMSVTDNSDPNASFTVNEPCGAAQCENESAEWIAEAPCCKSGSTVYNLSDFGEWKATETQTTYEGTVGPIEISPTVYEISMIDPSKAVKARPTALKQTGALFKVKWIKAN